MDGSMSFEEFAAVRRRRKQQEENVAKEDGRKERVVGAEAGREAEDEGESGVLARLGGALQTQELQLVLVVLIVVDFLSGFYQLYAQARGWQSPMLSILEYQSGLCLLLFSLELGLVLLAFRSETLSHFGYSLDIAVVGAMYYGILASPGPGSALVPGTRILNVLRLWRVVRMINGAIAASEQAHAATKTELADLQDKVEGFKLRARKAEQAAKRETDKYRRLEQSFRAQRDELDTMREALQIAAQTMAKVQGLESIAGLMGAEEQLELERVVEEERSTSRRKAGASSTGLEAVGGKEAGEEDDDDFVDYPDVADDDNSEADPTRNGDVSPLQRRGQAGSSEAWAALASAEPQDTSS